MKIGNLTICTQQDETISFEYRYFFLFNEGVYNFLKSNSQVYNFTYKLHFTILDYRQNFEGGFRLKSMVEITW